MEYQDKELICLECKQPFHFTASEQAFYAGQGVCTTKALLELSG
ncbi:MAG: zinc-ribbon domain-containing protein [Pseudomonadota bacterium]|nr:zinc-ribbon domain-containing protein [Pseudomonadota bacterium]